MTFKIFISSAVISAIVAALGNIIAAKIAQKTAKETAQETANKEIEKLERTWEREDLVSSDEEFAEMATKVSAFVYFADGTGGLDALKTIAAIRSKEKGEIACMLDRLYTAVHRDNYQDADDLLTSAINEKRRIKAGTQAKQ